MFYFDGLSPRKVCMHVLMEYFIFQKSNVIYDIFHKIIVHI